jgi:RES domain-containing protein
MTTPQITTIDELSALDLVRQAAQRGHERIADAAAKAVAELEAQAAALAAAWDAANHELGLPVWMIDYLEQPERDEDPERCTIRRLELPACSPIIIRREGRFTPWDMAKVYALQPISLQWDEEWFIAHGSGPALPLELLDLAIADATDAGRQWHALSLECARRNELGLTPADINPPAPATPETPDLIDQTHILIRELTAGTALCKANGTDVTDSAVVLATAIMSAAEQLRRLADMREADHAPLGF